MNRRRLLRRLRRGHLANVRFGDFVDLVNAFGFDELRVSGSHHFFAHRETKATLDIQPAGGEAKQYQLRQFLGLVDRYHLGMEDE